MLLPPDLAVVDSSQDNVAVFVEELCMLEINQHICSGLSNKQAFSRLAVGVQISSG